MKKIAVIMGSDSDMPVMKGCFETLKKYGVPFEGRIISAHRTPDEAKEFASRARENGFGAIIAAAGKAAHLGGFLAAYTTLPVIAVPIKGSAFLGLDSLLSMVQMPQGVPVATVAVDGSVNAAILAVQILSVEDGSLARALAQSKEEMKESVREKDKRIREELDSL